MHDVPAGDAPVAAVRLLRDRTVARALRSYVRWIGRSVGWWTVAYLVFWLAVFVIAGIESLPRLDAPLAGPLPGIAGSAAAVLMLSPLALRRVPPVRLDRRDLLRLALAPVAPWRALRWPFARAWLARGVAGVIAGLAWTLLAGAWFHVGAPWAAPAAALLLLAHLNLVWALYAERGRPLPRRPGLGLTLAAALLGLLGWVAPELGLAAALTGAHPGGLLPPALLAGLSLLAARRSLRESYPPRFAPQCFVLGQLQALRMWDAMSRMAGAGSGSDPGERERLLAVLHDTPYARRPRRSIPLPDPARPVWSAVAWRGLQSLVRRPILRGASLPLLLAGAFVTAGSGSGALLGAQLPAFALTWAAAALLGPSGYPATLPLRPADRTLGRIAPGMALALVVALACLAAAGAAGVAPPPLRVVETLALLPVVFAGLEKISTWMGSASAPEAVIAAAILASTPSLLASAFGVPELVVPGQLLLGIAALLLPI